jgi:hypothetical protein
MLKNFQEIAGWHLEKICLLWALAREFFQVAPAALIRLFSLPKTIA